MNEVKVWVDPSTDGSSPTKDVDHHDDAGWDLYAAEALQLHPGERGIVKTGLYMAIPSGQVGLIWPRSGLAAKQGVDVLAGVIDASYRKEVGVVLLNTGDEVVNINVGDRVAQILFQEVNITPIVQVAWKKELGETTRGEGFGSSGR